MFTQFYGIKEKITEIKSLAEEKWREAGLNFCELEQLKNERVSTIIIAVKGAGYDNSAPQQKDKPEGGNILWQV